MRPLIVMSLPFALLTLAWGSLLADGPAEAGKEQPAVAKRIDQGQNDPRLKGYFTPAGIKVEIVAEEPVVLNPVGMTFDSDGTLYVLEWLPAAGKLRQDEVTFTFKDGTQRKVTVLRKPIKDRVKKLFSRRSPNGAEGKGVYDQAQVVLQEEMPSSILLHDGWMYLTGRGSVRRYKLADLAKYECPQEPESTNGKAGDRRPKAEVIARGFGGVGQQQVSGLTLGNDGLLYVTAGAGDNRVEGADGSRADVLRSGAIFRCRPDGSKLETFALGFCNPYRDVSFDSAYNLFHADNDGGSGPAFRGCRLMHVAEGCDFGWRQQPGTNARRPDPVRTATAGELPGTMRPLLNTGRGSPAGLVIYNDSQLPERYRGLIFYPDVSCKLVRAYRVEPKGASFEVAEEFEFLKSNDPLFRPCQMVVGPDGALYVCDWRTDSTGAGRLWGDGKHGRIYRLSWAGAGDQPAIPLRGLDSWAKVVKQADEGLIKSLAAADFSERQQARAELVRRATHEQADVKKLVPALVKLVQDGEQTLPGRLTALGALHAFWNAEVAEVFVALLHDPNPDLRRLAAEGLGLKSRPGDRDMHEALVQALGDENPAARRAILLAIGRVNAPGAADVVVSALQFDEGKDPYLRDGILRAIERVGRPAVDKVLTLADSGVGKDLDHAVAAFLAFRTRPGALALPILLKKYHLSGAKKVELIRSYNNYLLDPPLSLEPLAEYLAELPRPPGGAKLSKQETAEQTALVPVRLAGVQILAAGGPLLGPRAQALLLSLLDEPAVEVRVAAINAIADARLGRAAPRLERLLQGTPTAAERTAITRALKVLEK